MARLEKIWIKRARRGPMDPTEEARMVADLGLEGNANQGGRRQVTVIEKEVFDRLREELDPTIDPVFRRANLMVSGVRLEETRDHLLHVGDTVLRIGGETRPCNRMDEALPGLQEALDPGWRGGCYGVVVEGGPIRVGDPVRLEPPEA